jgi:hypothetical protein
MSASVVAEDAPTSRPGVNGAESPVEMRIRGVYLYLVMFTRRMEATVMIDDEDTRNFALRDDIGNETSVFSGRTPRQAALKAARRLDPAKSEQQAEHHELRLREKGTTKVHIYDGWAWTEEAPDDKPDWMPASITEANVSKKGIEHLESI